jgi:hypothetical protein
MKTFFHNTSTILLFNAFLLGASIFSTLLFLGCSKTTAPENTRIETSGPYSITDTIRVRFGKELDTTVFSIGSNNGSFRYHFESRQDLLIYGDTLALGIPHFQVGKDFSMQLDNILDLNRNTVSEPFTIDASFIPWLDGDYSAEPLLQNNYIDTLVHVDQQQWYNQSSFQDTLSTEGIIWKDFGSHIDSRDYKVVYITPQVAAGKTFTISLKALKDKEFRVFAVGPFKVNNFNLTDVENTLSQERETTSANWNLLRWADSTSQKDPIVSSTLELNLKDYNQLTSSDGLSNERAFMVIRIESKNDNTGFYQLRTHFGEP